MNRIFAIAVNTYREAVRDRVLYVVTALACAVLISTLAMAELALDQQRRVVMDLGLATISIFSVLVAVFLGSSLLFKEIERKTLYVILPKPIHRWEFLVGKFAGITLTVATFIALMGGIQLVVMALQHELSALEALGVVAGLGAVLALALWKAPDRTAVWAPFSALALAVAWLLARSADVDATPVLASLVLYVGEVSILTSVALLFSSFSTPFTTGGLTLGVWLVGRSADTMETIHSRALNDQIEAVLHALAKVVPNFNLFVPGHSVLMTPWSYVGTAMGYAVAFTIVLLVMASVIFRRRDFL